MTGREAGNAPPLVSVRELSKSYVQKGGFLRSRFAVAALRGVNLEIPAGCTFALVGESGCGKSTLARCIAGLEDYDSGEIWIEGRKRLSLDQPDRVLLSRQAQLVFQESASALNPNFTAAEIVAEPLLIQGTETERERLRKALELMERVGLSADAARRSPAEFSGGQRQRLAIARALTLRPKLLMLDEAFSGLDLLTQVQVVHLLQELQASFGLTYLCITHDLSLVEQWADEVAVMSRGRIVARLRNNELLERSLQRLTESLVPLVPATEATAEA